MKTLQQIRAGLPAYPIELEKPDISCWRDGNTGVEYVHSFDSDVPGPHVMINALTHGNEVCGAIAVDTLLRSGLRPVCGRLTLAFANVAAYESFDPADPDATRYIDEDMNRVWAESVLDGQRDSAELRRARELRPIIDSVDYLLDIHSMHEKADPLILTGPLDKAVDFARRLDSPAHLMIDAGHASGTRLRDYGGFADPRSDKNALLVECGQHFERASRDVALDTVSRFLVATGVVELRDVALWMGPGGEVEPLSIRITDAVVAETMDFRFDADYFGMEIIAKAGSRIATDGGREVLTPYDRCVIMQPSLRHLGPGVTVVRLGEIVT